jgi:hypothetical protein
MILRVCSYRPSIKPQAKIDLVSWDRITPEKIKSGFNLSQIRMRKNVRSYIVFRRVPTSMSLILCVSMGIKGLIEHTNKSYVIKLIQLT